MNYTDARPLIQSGDVFAWRGRNFWSRLIRSWTGSSWSHVGIAWVVGGRVLVLEARFHGGVRCVPLSKLLPCDWITGQGLTDEQLTRALDELGGGYSTIDAIRAGLGLDPNQPGRQCSEYIKTVLGIDCDPTPGAVAETMLKSGVLQEVV